MQDVGGFQPSSPMMVELLNIMIIGLGLNYKLFFWSFLFDFIFYSFVVETCVEYSTKFCLRVSSDKLFTCHCCQYSLALLLVYISFP